MATRVTPLPERLVATPWLALLGILALSQTAHLFEHVMFQGTKHIPEDKHFEYLQKAGASGVNGSTHTDLTNYYEVVPSNQLELALWLERSIVTKLTPASTSRRACKACLAQGCSP